MVRGGNSLTDFFLKRCVYGDCQTRFKELPNKKYCEIHAKVRQLESMKQAILKKQIKRAKEPLVEVKCHHCKEMTYSISGAKRFCSDTCRNKHFQLKVRIKRKEKQIVKYQQQLDELRAKL